MHSNFQTCLNFVLQDEGGDTVDDGGPTSRGVTQATYNRWCATHGLPVDSVFDASDSTVAQIYYQYYWLPYCDPLPKGEDYLLFDMNVNMGGRQATILLQRALGVADDGIFGPKTMAAAMGADVNTLLPAITAQKVAFYREVVLEHPSDSAYYQGWLNRVEAVQARIPTIELRALKMMRT
jgi:lysozyme family protein